MRTPIPGLLPAEELEPKCRNCKKKICNKTKILELSHYLNITYTHVFTNRYDITRYSLIEDLGIVQLTPKEMAKIPDRLTALPKLQFKELKRRLVEIKQPLNIYSNISFILIMIGGLILCPVIAYVLWRIYRVRSSIRGVKPMVKIFNDKKDHLFNIGDIVSNRLQTLEAKFSSLIGPVTPDASPRTSPTLPSTSNRPTSPPRCDSIPMLDINITPQSYTGNCEGHRKTKV